MKKEKNLLDTKIVVKPRLLDYAFILGWSMYLWAANPSYRSIVLMIGLLMIASGVYRMMRQIAPGPSGKLDYEVSRVEALQGFLSALVGIMFVAYSQNVEVVDKWVGSLLR